MQECVAAAVAVSAEKQVLEAVGGCLHTLITTIELQHHAPRVWASFDQHHDQLRQSWFDCSEHLQGRVQEALSQPVYVGPPLLRDQSVTLQTKHSISSFLDRLAYSADLPASINPTVRVLFVTWFFVFVFVLFFANVRNLRIIS